LQDNYVLNSKEKKLENFMNHGQVLRTHWFLVAEAMPQIHTYTLLLSCTCFFFLLLLSITFISIPSLILG